MCSAGSRVEEKVALSHSDEAEEGASETTHRQKTIHREETRDDDVRRIPDRLDVDVGQGAILGMRTGYLRLRRRRVVSTGYTAFVVTSVDPVQDIPLGKSSESRPLVFVGGQRV